MKPDHKMRHYYTAAAWSIVIMLITLFSICAHSQTVEHRKYKEAPKPWTNYKYFESRKPTKFFDWSDYAESLDKKHFWIWSTFALSGTVDGMLQGYHARPTCFEKAWGVSDRSFFGSEAWVRSYKNNDPAQPHKSELLGNVGRDFWHTGNWMMSATFGIGSYAQGSRKQPWKYKIANYALGLAIHSAFANLSYNLLR